jgi:putative hydrolase of the HAD superfamily
MQAPITRAVGFDLDNTLYDQELHVLPFFFAAAARLSDATGLQSALIENSFREAWKSLGPAHPRLFNVVLERHGINNQERVQMLVRMYHGEVGSLELYPGVRMLLERLRQRFSLFLITDGNAAMQRNKVERLGIGPLFRAMVFSAEQEMGLPKPHPSPFLRALESLQCEPAECLFAGDNPRCDIAGAAGVGMRTARVLTGPFRTEAVAGIAPDLIVDSVIDIEGVLS